MGSVGALAPAVVVSVRCRDLSTNVEARPPSILSGRLRGSSREIEARFRRTWARMMARTGPPHVHWSSPMGPPASSDRRPRSRAVMRPRVTIADLMVVVAFTALASFGVSTGLEGLIVGQMVGLYL